MAKFKTFSQLTDAKRHRLELLIYEGHNQKSCAHSLKVNEGTISRELNRYSKKDGVYDAEVAIDKARVKRSNSKHQGMKIEKDKLLKEHIIKELKEKRSPDEISGRMKKNKEPFYASKNAIYEWLWSSYGQRYCKYLCTKRYHKKKNTGSTKREMIPALISFREAPQGSLNKTRYKHSEFDTMVSKKDALGKDALAVVTFKKEKLVRLKKIPNMRPSSMAKVIREINKNTPSLSMIGDRGIENKNHQSFGVDTYFCDPHSPWQKPHVENQNALIRRWWFPKGTDWSQVSDEQVQEAEDHINNKWRKSLNYSSAIEISIKHGTLKEKLIV